MINLLSCRLSHRRKNICYLSMMDTFSQLDKYFFLSCWEQLDKKQTDIFCRRVFFPKTSVKQKIGKRSNHFFHSPLPNQFRWVLLVNELKLVFSFKGCSLMIQFCLFLALNVYMKEVTAVEQFKLVKNGMIWHRPKPLFSISLSFSLTY